MLMRLDVTRSASASKGGLTWKRFSDSKEFVMKMFRLLAATALLMLSVPGIPALAQSPRWGESLCFPFGGMEFCYFETRAQCQYARAKEANAFRDEGLTVEQCQPSDVIPGFEWEFFATFF